MIPPRMVPPGVLQLYEVEGDTKTLIQELPTSLKNREKINQMRNDILMVHPKKTIVITENNAWN